MKRLIYIITACLNGMTAFGQTADRVDFPIIQWDTVMYRNGLTVMAAEIIVNDHDQSLYLAAMDPDNFRFDLFQEPRRTRVDKTARRKGAAAAINGGFFRTDTREAAATGYLRLDGITRSENQSDSRNNAVIVMEEGGKIGMASWVDFISDSVNLAHYPDVLASGPLLIYRSEEIYRTLSGTDRHPRSVIGCKADGTVIMLVVDGRRRGADGMTLHELDLLCKAVGLTDAVNLDGGGSSTLWTSYTGILNRPSDKIGFLRIPRKVANGILATPITE